MTDISRFAPPATPLAVGRMRRASDAPYEHHGASTVAARRGVRVGQPAPFVTRDGTPDAGHEGATLGTSQARLHHYFEASCDAHPTATALVVEGVQLTYAGLDEQANRLAHHLARQLGRYGTGPGARVAILLQRSVHTYVTLLAVQKAGATFVPIDPSSPQDRVEYITGDSAVDLLVTTSDLAEVAATSGCPVVLVDELDAVLASMPETRLELAPGPGVPEGAEPDEQDDPTAYIIYTSGSSGRPKGVEVAQSSICNFISVVPPLYRVTSADRVYQGMTIAFDFSIEEIWPTWAVGATLVAGPNDGRRLGADLREFLHEHRVTVLYCVPTVLNTIDGDLPLVHTLNVGGEACPAELVERWSTGSRVILNTYGPTETTVTAIMARLTPGTPVTIGAPLPTYGAHLMDAELREVPYGEVGEICITGPGVARGYVGRPGLTAEKFVPDPFGGPGRMYRTGDLGRLTEHGIEYLGRADSEVKVRGHRIDLQEIENVLRLDDVVADAVATVWSQTNELAAYVTRLDGEPDDQLVARLHRRLVDTLTPYMVPAYLTVMDVLPMLPSGKVDRKALPPPSGGRLISDSVPYTAPATATEQGVCDVWAESLGVSPDQVSTDADFFTDLGGHSLAAATVVSTLRRRHGAGHLAIGDLYAHPTVRKLARYLDAAPAQSTAEGRPAVAPQRHGTGRVALAGLAQFGMLYALLAIFTLPVALVYAANDGVPSRQVMMLLITLLPATYLLGRWVLPVVGSRLLSIGLKPGTYPLWGAVHLRVWAIQRLLSLAPTMVLSGSPLMLPYLRALGARVGRRTHIATGEIDLPTFVDIGDRASVGYGVQLQTSVVEGGRLTLGTVRVGDRAFVGASSMVVAGSTVGVRSALAEHSVLGPDQRIPDGDRWEGSPPVPATDADPVVEAMASTRAPASWPIGLLAGFAAGLVVLELLPFVAILPVVWLVWTVLLDAGVPAALAVTALSGPLYVLAVCALIAVLRHAFVGRSRTGVQPLRSRVGLGKWFLDKLLEASLLLTNSLYATLYTVPWLRILGARIGAGSEVSTVAHIDPDLLVLSPQSFVADMARVGSATYHNGNIAMDTTEIGSRAFVGNASFIPSGTVLEDGSLIGVHSVPPRGGVPEESSWLGSPAIFLPRRQESQVFDDAQTFRPSRLKKLERLGVEFLRITLPGSLLAVAVFLALFGVSFVAEDAPAWVVVVAAPVAFLALGLATVLLVAALKWILVGAYRPRVEPLWSRFVRRSELVTGLYEAAAVPALLQGLTGTPLLGPFLRLFGVRVGRRTWIDSTYLTEFDLVSIGDDACVGTGASLQTHLFEDRVMKMSALSIEDGATVGVRSVVLYDAVVGAGTTLEPLSLVMKGESLMPATRWGGIPAQFQG